MRLSNPKINQRSRLDHVKVKIRQIRRRPVGESPKAPERVLRMVAAEKEVTPEKVCLMTDVWPITVLPKWAQWTIRFIYFRYGWAATARRGDDGMYYSVEYRGVTPDEAEARYLSSEPNASYTKIPWRSCLPIQTAQFSTHDFPLSEVSYKYRNRKLPYSVVQTKELDDQLLLEAKIEQVARAASAA